MKALVCECCGGRIDRATMTNEEARTTILSKIELLLGSINEGSKREVDLMVAQTIEALSEAYKNLEENNGKDS